MTQAAACPVRPAARGRVLVIVGAECTGKSTLMAELAHALQTDQRRVACVPETLREWCDHHGRTPRAEEQAAIAATHTARIDAAALTHDLVLADTSALVTAVYSEALFNDPTLYPAAVQAHAQVDLCLLTSIDLPWQADGHQRDGPAARAAIDALLRARLMQFGMAWSVISGRGPRRLHAALAAAQRLLADHQPLPLHDDHGEGRAAWHHWAHHCERCSDPEGERRLFPRG